MKNNKLNKLILLGLIPFLACCTPAKKRYPQTDTADVSVTAIDRTNKTITITNDSDYYLLEEYITFDSVKSSDSLVYLKEKQDTFVDSYRGQQHLVRPHSTDLLTASGTLPEQDCLTAKMVSYVAVDKFTLATGSDAIEAGEDDNNLYIHGTCTSESPCYTIVDGVYDGTPFAMVVMNMPLYGRVTLTFSEKPDVSKVTINCVKIVEYAVPEKSPGQKAFAAVGNVLKWGLVLFLCSPLIAGAIVGIVCIIKGAKKKKQK